MISILNIISDFVVDWYYLDKTTQEVQVYWNLTEVQLEEKATYKINGEVVVVDW